MLEYRLEREIRELICAAAHDAAVRKKDLECLCLPCLSGYFVSFMEFKDVRDVTAIGYEQIETWVCPDCGESESLLKNGGRYERSKG